jgi:hypothetical protein
MRPLFFLLAFLLLATVVASDYTSSPLTDPAYSWGIHENESLGLPWYGVQPWEVEVCTRGLTTSYGYDPAANQIADVHLSSPIYRDTLTLTAQKSNGSNLTYYEIGWYVQPYEHALAVSVTLMDRLDNEMELDAATATPSGSFAGYVIFPHPCDPALTSCPSFEAPPYRVRLEWQTMINGVGGSENMLLSDFREVTP